MKIPALNSLCILFLSLKISSTFSTTSDASDEDQKFLGKFYMQESTKAIIKLGMDADERKEYQNDVKNTYTEISKEAHGLWRIKITELNRTQDITFKLGEEFSETPLDGRTCKTVVTKWRNRLTHSQLCNFGQDSVITREFNGNTQKVTINSSSSSKSFIMKRE